MFNDRMYTIIPVREATGHLAIVSSLEVLRAYLVLLTILNGGYPVGTHSVALDVGDRPGSIPLSCRLNTPDLLRYGFSGRTGGYSSHRATLRSSNGLEEIGLEGAKRWSTWWLDPRNKPVIDHWLSPDDEASPMATIEGLVRTTWRPGRFLEYRGALSIAMDRMGLGDLFCGDATDEADRARKRKRVTQALVEAHNHKKHIARWHGEDYVSVSMFALDAEVFMSFLVAYGVLVAADIGTDPSVDPHGLRGRWVRVIRESYKNVIEPTIAELPDAIWQRR